MKLFTFLVFCYFAQTVHADVTANNSSCSSIIANTANSQFTLTQHTLTDASQQLVITERAESMPTKIHQVTFGGHFIKPLTSACIFTPLAFKQGGMDTNFWGWHMLWSQAEGLFYARMDGEAWVSSVPKRLTKLTPNNTQFKQEQDTITITWQQTENGLMANMQAVSTDEGRSWEISTY